MHHMIHKLTTVAAVLMLVTTSTIALHQSYRRNIIAQYPQPFVTFPSQFWPQESFQYQSPVADYFGRRGGRNGLPVYGGAGIGERHANGLDSNGRGAYPLDVN
ncbi:hypothetical protein DPMN_146204 [Dreissena polymorpha]|uniref:Uncharacterized protein n=1 Tax=Dreissena polymorpha TaxID=45954 RepID=A0A9D4F9W7_DREPO|nr:hypothetical protein DPMN_146204 [Dreissena polymorpha]